jgi:hypothetical protein
LLNGLQKRKYEYEGDFLGSLSSSSTTTVVAGSWLIPVKKMMTSAEVESMNQCCSEGEGIKITAPDLSRTPAANALMLVGDREHFKILIEFSFHVAAEKKEKELCMVVT